MNVMAARAEMPACDLATASGTGSTGSTTSTAPEAAEVCGPSTNEQLKSTLELAADTVHEVGFSKSEGDCLTNVKLYGVWAAATWPASQPTAIVFRMTEGRWRAVSGGTAIDQGGKEPVPRAVLEGQP
jgi:hypothetical protein